MEKAKEYFDEAIERDPNYALAYVGLANCYYVLPSNAPVSHTEVNLKELAMAKRALSIDEALDEAHTALAGAYQDSWQWEDAEREFRRALEINPNDATAHNWYGLFRSSLGRAATKRFFTCNAPCNWIR